jgi:hypothetical protein
VEAEAPPYQRRDQYLPLSLGMVLIMMRRRRRRYSR